MVKPSKSMQPDHVDLQKASKRRAAFGEDSFHNYMALKIANQRQQFGLILPPPPAAATTPSKLKSPTQAPKPKPNPPPQKQDGFAESFEAFPKLSSTNAPTPVTRQLRADLPNIMSAETMQRNPVSERILPPSLKKITNPASSVRSSYKRPTLLERSSLAPPMSQTAYPITDGSPPSANRAASDGTNINDCDTSDRSVRFADHIGAESTSTGGEKMGTKHKPNTKTKMESLIGRLKKRHGRGNRRLERNNAKKRKTGRHSNRIIQGDEEKDAKMDMSTTLFEHENGLAELDRLFATIDEKDLKIHSDNDGHNNRQGAEINTTTISTEEGTLASMVENNLVELDRMFATAETANDDASPSSLHRNEMGDDNQDISKQQRGSLNELGRMFSTTGSANGENGSPILLSNDGLGEINHDVPKHQQNSQIKLDVLCSKAEVENIDDSPPSLFYSEDTMLNNLDIPGKHQAADIMLAMSSEKQASDEGEESSIPTPSPTAALSATPSPKCVKRLRPDLFFYGVVVKIAGYTFPDNETIKRLLQKHGGDLETYETERVTHIIAQQLSMAKANAYKKARRPRPVCRPSWIVDSIREGKLLPYGNYLLIEGRDQQQMGIQTMFQKHTEDGKKQPPKISTKPSSPEKPLLHTNPYAKKNQIVQSPEKRHGNQSSLDERAQLSPAKDAHNSNRGSLKNPEKMDKNFNGKIRTVGTDPNFLDSYFASSRLSFIGSFKQRTPVTHHSNDTRPLPLFSNSKKLIFHVDMDCFFASVVLRNFPQYQDKPVVISHHGNRSNNEREDDERGNNFNTSLGHVPKNSSSECATCNYEARKYGVKKGMFLGRAKELCPELVVLMYDFEGYEEVSQQVLDILDRLVASENHRGIVETVSCDEAYVELNFDASEESEKSYDRAYLMAESIRNEIFDTTRCTASIGVGANKFLAKLGTDKAKPNKAYCVRNYRELLKGLQLRDMHGIGRRTEKKLIDEGLVSVQDVWDLGSRGETELIRILGPGTGKKIYRFTQGKDDRPITPVERKTIGAECNYGVRFDGPYGIDHFMEGLAKEVEKRMKGISMKGKKLTLKIKQRKKGATNKHKFLGHGSCHNLSKSVGILGNTATRDAKLFKKIGLGLFRDFAIADIHEIRGMGITISSLENDNNNGKQTNASGMQYWLDHSNEPGTVDDSRTTEEAMVLKEFSEQEAIETKSILLSTPKPNKKLYEEIVVEKVVRNEQSPLMIELPPMSQIQMSQIDALPSELQQQIFSKMKEAGAGRIGEDILEGTIVPGTVKDRSTEKAGKTKQFIREESPTTNNTLISTPQSIGKIGNEVDQDGGVLKIIESPLLIELPPMSQIHMTQVEALPPALQQQIHSRMNQRITGVLEEEIGDVTDEAYPINHAITKHQSFESEHQHSVNRFRQTDLKRMMKLAAVRSGHENTSISLTQLEQLPLEIKLQVVNRDDRQIGILSQHVPRPTGFKDRLPRKSISNAANAICVARSKPKRTISNHAKNGRDRKQIANTSSTLNSTSAEKRKSVSQKSRREFRLKDKVDVWKEDLVPLKAFLNDNCPLRYPNSVDMVLEFLSIVLKEGRLPAMVTMIRCIRNREDEWSKIEIIEKIAWTMNDLHIERYGASLDVGWLMGMEE